MVFPNISVNSNLTIRFRGPRINDKPIRPVTITKVPNPFKIIKAMILLSFTCLNNTDFIPASFIEFSQLLYFQINEDFPPNNPMFMEFYAFYIVCANSNAIILEKFINENRVSKKHVILSNYPGRLFETH